MENHPFELKLDADRLEVKVRLSIFIITGVCAGLPALVWSVSDLIHHRKNGHCISIFIFLLLITDFVELFLSPYILSKYLLDEFPSFKDWTWWVLSSLWWSSRACGFLLNQLVALEGILSVKDPLYNACFSLPCFRILYILVLLCFCFYAIAVNPIHIIPLVFFALVIIRTLPCGVSCSAARHSHTSRKLDYHILVVSMYSLLVLVLYPTLMLLNSYFVLPLQLSVLFIPNFLMSMRLISDPLLCVLVCRQNLSIQTSQTSEGTRLV